MKKHLLWTNVLILCLAFTQASWAQYDLGWIRNFGKAGDDGGKCVVPSINGGMWVVGYVQQLSNLKADAWIIRVDADGRNLWDVAYGGRKWDEARAAIETADGSLVVLGVTESKGNGKSDVWLFKLNAEGDMLWDKTFGDKDWDEGFAVIETKDGGLMLAGSYKPKKRDDDLWAIRTDSQGQQLWEVRLGGQEWEGAHDVIELPDGSFILAGHAASESLGEDDGWLVKISSKGQVLWSRHFGGPGRDALHSLQQANDSTLLVAGFTRSKGNGAGDLWIIGVDLDGILRWEATIGGNHFEKARSMVMTPTGELVLAGYTLSQGLGSGDVWVLKTTSKGEKLWEKTYGGTGFDKAFDAAIMPDGAIAIVGNTSLGGQQNILLIQLLPAVAD